MKPLSLLLLLKSAAFCLSFVPSLRDQRAWASHERWLYNDYMTREELTNDKQGNPIGTAVYDIKPEGLSSNAPTAFFLHGQPNWSYLYREIIPFIAGCRESDYPSLSSGQEPWCRFGEMEPVGNVLSLDYMGFGQSDHPGDPTVYGYRITDRVSEVEAVVDEFIDSPRVTAISQDWGTGIIQGYMHRHPDDHGIHSWIFSESVSVSQPLPPFGVPFFGRLNSLEAFDLCLEDSYFVEIQLLSPDAQPGDQEFMGKVFGSGSFRTLGDNEMSLFRAPQDTPQNRWGQLTFVNELAIIPTDGFDPEGNRLVQGYPIDVADMLNGGLEVLLADCLPTLFIEGNPGFLTAQVAGLFEPEFQNLCPNDLYKTEPVTGIHYLWHDSPWEYGCAVRNFFIDVHGLDPSLKLQNCADIWQATEGPATPSSGPATPSGCEPEDGMVLGDRLMRIDDLSMEECCEECNDNSDCVVWNYMEGQAVCALFSTNERTNDNDLWVHGYAAGNGSGDAISNLEGQDLPENNGGAGNIES